VTLPDLLASPLVVNIGTAVARAVAKGLVGWQALKYREKRLERDLDALRGQDQAKRARIEELERALAASGQESAGPVARKSEIVSALNDLLDHAQAERASFYVPVHNTGGEFLGLIVLATAPSDLSANSFIGTVFSGRDSRAVQCYLNGETTISDSTEFSFDRFRAAETYSDCLQTSGLTGDVQLLSGPGGHIDTERADAAIAAFRTRLVDLACCFTGENERLIDLTDLKVPRESRRGTVLSIDISNSSGLFVDEARSFVTRKIMGDLLRASVEAINAGNGIFESFTGDGFIAAFSGGARDRHNNPAERGLACALAVNAAFEDLMRTYRADLAHLDVQLFLRFGIATGAIHPITLSFGQLRTSRIVGRTPSPAKKLCDRGPRDRASIIIDFATYSELSGGERGQFEPLQPAAASIGRATPSDRVFRYTALASPALSRQA